MSPSTATNPFLVTGKSERSLEEFDVSPLICRGKKRVICDACDRPKESTCICDALPSQKVQLNNAYCIILQHPNEAKQHQNRSLPFIEHCIDSKHYLKIVGRRFPSLIDESSQSVSATSTSRSTGKCCELNPNVGSRIDHHNNESRLSYVQKMHSILTERSVHSSDIPTVWLLAPNDETSISLTEALQQWEKRKQNFSNDAIYPKIIVLAMDATWKYAKEMDRANVLHRSYPTTLMQRIQLTPSDFNHPLFTTNQKQRSASDNESECSSFHRFSIRTPPKSSANDNTGIVYLSTAECLAYVLARIEQQNDIYSIVMKPLDLMVRQWQGHRKGKSKVQNSAKSPTGTLTPTPNPLL